ncbi:MAG: class I SAM-dependent methyltransferase, partial [Caldilineaceae bacterium]|nr:class I SAM-dependent methyltransferase [Caldilineaceae bacterium]
KAQKIVQILQDYLGSRLRQARCLDLGCGNGVISRTLAAEIDQVIGMDLDPVLIRNGQAAHSHGFAMADAGQVPLADASCDIVVCAQVYEHTDDQPALAREIWRVLKPGGICFFSGPNRLAVMEEHYWLPFLSWLPLPLAHRYMQLLGRGSYYDIRPLTPWQARRLWGRFAVIDYTETMLTDPARFGIADKIAQSWWFDLIPKQAIKLLLPLVPNYNWILVKRNP